MPPLLLRDDDDAGDALDRRGYTANPVISSACSGRVAACARLSPVNPDRTRLAFHVSFGPVYGSLDTAGE